MGAFNTVAMILECSNCHETVEKQIQFKYGDCWQHEYSVGDRLTWGGNDEGQPGVQRVRVRAMAGACPNCQCLGHEWFEVVIKRDVITSVRPSTAMPEFFYVIEGE